MDIVGTAAEAIRSGDISSAESLLETHLEAHPSDARAIHAKGLVRQHQGRLKEASELIFQAISLCPSEPSFFNNLGNVFRAAGAEADACLAYRQALELNPENTSALRNLGAVLARAGEPEEATEVLARLIQLDRLDAGAYHQLAGCLKLLGRLQEAIENLRLSIRLNPESGSANNDLALALREQGKLHDALMHAKKAVEHSPDIAMFRANLALINHHLGEVKDAITAASEAIAIDPESSHAHNAMGLIYFELGETPKALEHLHRAVRLNPSMTLAYNNLGVTLRQAQKPNAAMECFERVLQLEPANVEAHFNRAITWLSECEFRQGWLEYEWRLLRETARKRTRRKPKWEGQPLGGRTILLHAEQGLGDTVQFIRFAAHVQQLQARVIVEIQPRLVPLMEDVLGVDEIVAESTPVDHDVQLPLMSVPAALRLKKSEDLESEPYLLADANRIDTTKSHSLRSSGFRIGIAWQGNSDYPGDAHRSIRLEHFGAIAEVDGVGLFSLQQGEGLEQLEAVEFDVVPLPQNWDLDGAFVDTAALMHHLDLVVTSDTALAHVAGALGRPVWVALSRSPDWRFQFGDEKTPWYSTMRLFRQSKLGQWDDVFERISKELSILIHEGAK